MSKNFFAALDDSGDEAPAPPKSKAVEKKPQNKAKPSNNKFAEPSKTDPKRPNTNDRNTKYGRGGRGPVRDGKRQYDRRSGTGRGREVKKGGGGARNWGSDKNEARQAEGHVDEDAVVTPPEEGKEDVTEQGAAEGEEAPVEEEEAVPEPEPEPEDITLSYEEYMATKANPDNEAFAPVKEREVANEFAGLSVKKKEEDEDFMMMGGGKQKKKKQNKGAPKQSITLDFRVTSSSGGGDDRRRDSGGRGGRDGRGRGRGGRGGRDGRGRGRDGGRGGRDGGRGGRGGRGQGGGRGGGGGRGQGGGRGLNVMDESAFPSLG
eukprot:Sro188_g081120.2  (319) ;mRNA; r:21983-23359